MLPPSKTSLVDAIGCDMAAEVLRDYGTLRLGVTGWSMFPAVCPGDILTIERMEISSASKGHIVLFRRGRRLFAHRVIEAATHQTGSRLLTRGDSMGTPDEPVSKDQFLGRVTALVRDGRSIDIRKDSRFLNRFISTLVQRSKFASRVLIGVHSFGSASRVQNKA